MSNTAFEQFMDRRIVREFEYLVYDQDVCLGSVFATSEEHAWQVARAKYRFTNEAPMYVVAK